MANNRPIVRLDPQGYVIQGYFEQTTKLIEYFIPNATEVPLYVGWAKPGTATDKAAWRICRLTYDGNDNITAQEWAEGTNDHVNVWDDRASYNYS